MHYCIKKIYHVYYTTQWNVISWSKFNHMTLTSSNEKWMRVADIVRRFFTLMVWVILSLRKLLQTAMHWQNRLFLTLQSLNLLSVCFFLAVINHVINKTKKSMQWRHRSVCIALRDINVYVKTGVTTIHELVTPN